MERSNEDELSSENVGESKPNLFEILTDLPSEVLLDSNSKEQVSNMAFTTTTVPEPGSGDNGKNENENDLDNLTKSQRKKLAKKMKWEENKVAKRLKTRAKKKEMKEKIKLGLLPKGDYLTRNQKKSHCMKNSTCKVGVAIDMSFDNLMNDKDMAKCIKQIHRCYSINRIQQNPMQFYVTSFSGIAREIMKKHQGWDNWDVNFTESSYLELEHFPKEKLVYLSSESENVLSELQDDCLYIIGGLVDHNSQKGLCHSLAVKLGVSHARLPISEHIDMKTRKVLTIDHVFEILELAAHKTPWDAALMQVIAPRKQPQLKTLDVDHSSSSNSSS